MLSRSERLVEFSQGAKGREAGTSPEHVAAHPHSDRFIVRGEHDRRWKGQIRKHFQQKHVTYGWEADLVSGVGEAVKPKHILPSQPASPRRAPA